MHEVPCSHDRLVQVSTITALTDWTRTPDGFHAPVESISKVLGEDTEWFECAECGDRVCPDLAP
jgi:hypothetical protein